jgi:hypothetical protein
MVHALSVEKVRPFHESENVNVGRSNQGGSATTAARDCYPNTTSEAQPLQPKTLKSPDGEAAANTEALMVEPSC